MKKAYVKPEVKKMKMAANQAIAACSKTTVTASGWQNGWCQTGTMYSSQEEARAAHNSDNAPIYPVYYIEGEWGHAYWNDANSGGVYNDYCQSQQGNVPNDINGALTTSTAVSMS